ncbi:MAG: WYL domain-containing protein [Oceanipulchritudo sp.]
MPARQPQSRSPLARMVRIHRCLVEGNHPNCSTLARAIEVSTKTIQRDLDYMRDQLGLPLEYCASAHGYAYTQPVTHFPTIPATEGEVLALFVAQKALEQYRGTPFEKPLANAFSKLSEVLEDAITVGLDDLSETLSFHHTGIAHTDMAVFQQVTRALMESRRLEFSYRKLNSRRPDRRSVEPYHLASIDGQWYLFANDLDRKDIRTFVLGRIQKVSAIGPQFTKPADFSLRERLMGSFGVFSGEGSFAVRIEFDPFAAQLVRERRWHPSQDLEEHPDGGLEMSLQLDSLEEVERWILSWGGHAKVLDPPRLKRRVQAALRDMQGIYREMPPWFSDLHEAARAHQPDRLLELVMALDSRSEAPGQMSLFRS